MFPPLSQAMRTNYCQSCSGLHAQSDFSKVMQSVTLSGLEGTFEY